MRFYTVSGKFRVTKGKKKKKTEGWSKWQRSKVSVYIHWPQNELDLKSKENTQKVKNPTD